MDAPCAGKDEPLSPIVGARATRAPLAKARGGWRCAEDGGDDATGFDETARQERIVVAGNLGDGAGCR